MRGQLALCLKSNRNLTNERTKNVKLKKENQEMRNKYTRSTFEFHSMLSLNNIYTLWFH